MNKVYVAASLDGFIADQKGSVDFLNNYPDIPGEDMGYNKFIASIDAILMGRKTFETVLAFGVEWPYQKPVFVWTATLTELPSVLEGKVFLVGGTLKEIISTLHESNHHSIYIDGGKTIQSFLQEDLVHEMTITTIPVLLGSGIPLFGDLTSVLSFKCVSNLMYSNGLVQHTYWRA